MNRTIFIADDDEGMLDLYKTIFKKGKKIFDIKTFTDGQYLLDNFKSAYELEHRVPLCILDMKMPVMDGITTAQEVCKIDHDVILIIITAYSIVTAEMVLESLEHDIYYIKKPFSLEELYALVDALLKSWNKSQQLKAYQKELDELRKIRDN